MLNRIRAVSPMLFACGFLLLPVITKAQTSQRFSVQGSVLRADIYGDNFSAVAPGFGFEVQARYTPGALSIGGGFQYTHHNDSQAEEDGYEGDIGLLGIFVEPRYGIYVGSDRVAPYLSARVGFARLDLWNQLPNDEGELTWSSPGVTLNGGGGILFRLSSRANLDLGATAGFTSYQTSEGRIDDGEPFDVELGSGTNLVVRLGIAIGLGR